MMRRLALVLCLAPAPAFAHAGHAYAGSVWSAWTFDPIITLPMLLAASLYAIGTARLWRRAGQGRGVQTWQVGCFSGGLLLTALALVSPLHFVGERVFTAHMIEHEILMAVAAPLLVLAHPLAALMSGLPRGLRNTLTAGAHSSPITTAWRFLIAAPVATTLHAAAIWIWHAPSLFDAAVLDETLHILQHLSFFVTALLFWWALFLRPLAEYGNAAFHVFVTMMHTGLLGALITLSPRLWYTVQTEHSLLWNLTPLEDQQLAGIVMWVPAGTIYAGIGLAFAGMWISGRGRKHAPVHP
jgi:putative membrane protein